MFQYMRVVVPELFSFFIPYSVLCEPVKS